MIDLHNEWNFVRVLARDRAQNPERGCDCVAAALNGELNDIFAVEIVWILGKARAAGMLDALIDRKDREVAGA